MQIPIAFSKSNKSLSKNVGVLSGDIGATKINLALFRTDGGDLTIIKEENFKTKEYPDLFTVLSKFLSGEKLPDCISLGVAGPVLNGEAQLTNLSWQINSRKISNAFNGLPVTLINDLEATAYGLMAMKEVDIYILHQGKQSKGNIAVIAPGTGLGEAGLYWDGKAYHPFATEGGHCDFAARTEMDFEFYWYLHNKFGHVSWERLVSGPGICSIYEFLVMQKGREEPVWLKDRLLAYDRAAVITENAENCPVCEETVNLFLHYLASECANLVLKLKATGGVFIGGGILPKILNLVHNDAFLKSFYDSRRLKPLLQQVPVNIILNDKAALLGAAWYAAYGK